MSRDRLARHTHARSLLPALESSAVPSHLHCLANLCCHHGSRKSITRVSVTCTYTRTADFTSRILMHTTDRKREFVTRAHAPKPHRPIEERIHRWAIQSRSMRVYWYGGMRIASFIHEFSSCTLIPEARIVRVTLHLFSPILPPPGAIDDDDDEHARSATQVTCTCFRRAYDTHTRGGPQCIGSQFLHLDVYCHWC